MPNRAYQLRLFALRYLVDSIPTANGHADCHCNTCWQFEDSATTLYRQTYLPWLYVLSYTQYDPRTIQIDDIDRKLHEPCMNAVAWFEPQPRVRRETATSKQTHTALPDALRDLEMFQDNSPRIRFPKDCTHCTLEGRSRPVFQDTLNSDIPSHISVILLPINCSDRPAILRDRQRT